MNIYTHDNVVEALIKACEVAGSQKKYADKMEYSTSFISDCCTGKRAIPDQLAKQLGFKIVYVRTK